MNNVFILAVGALLVLGGCKKDGDENKPSGGTHSVRLECDASNTSSIGLTITATQASGGNFSSGITPSRPIRQDLGTFTSSQTVRLTMLSNVRGTWPVGATVSGRLLVDGVVKGRCDLPATTTDANGRIYSDLTLDLSKL